MKVAVLKQSWSQPVQNFSMMLEDASKLVGPHTTRERGRQIPLLWDFCLLLFPALTNFVALRGCNALPTLDRYELGDFLEVTSTATMTAREKENMRRISESFKDQQEAGEFLKLKLTFKMLSD